MVAGPPERAFDAFVDPEALVAWLPPDGMRGRFERFDLRPGGSYRLVLTCADASASPASPWGEAAVRSPPLVLVGGRLACPA